jgi:hypothetical protein
VESREKEILVLRKTLLETFYKVFINFLANPSLERFKIFTPQAIDVLERPIPKFKKHKHKNI